MTQATHKTRDPQAYHRQQERAKEEAQKAADLQAELDGRDLEWVMADERGRRFLRRLLFRHLGLEQLKFEPNASLMANRVGQYTVGLEIQDWLRERCPDAFLQLLAEQKDDHSAASSRNEKQRR